MSYILDALKRADTERARGAVPGLHTRQLATPSDDTVPSGRSRLWLAVAAAVALGGVGLWVWQTPVQAPVAVVLKPVVVQPSAVVSKPTAALPVIPTTVKAGAKPMPATKSPVPPKPEVKPEPSVAVAAPAKAPATLAALPLLSELPEELRRQVPPLTITGAVYSENPAQRLLLVNNLVLTQGALAAPELTLEEIRPRSSVFSFRGTRFRVAH